METGAERSEGVRVLSATCAWLRGTLFPAELECAAPWRSGRKPADSRWAVPVTLLLDS